MLVMKLKPNNRKSGMDSRYFCINLMYLLTHTSENQLLRDLITLYENNLPEFFRYSSDFSFGCRSSETRQKGSYGFGPSEFSRASDPKPKFSVVAERKREPEGATKKATSHKNITFRMRFLFCVRI
jgi:hypothetical protein